MRSCRVQRASRSVFGIPPLIIGLTIVAPEGLPAPMQLITFDLRVMVVVAIVLLPLIITEYTVSRQEGVLLLFWGAVYLVWTVLTATGSPLLSWFTPIVFFRLFPATVVFLVVTVVIALRGPKQRLRR